MKKFALWVAVLLTACSLPISNPTPEPTTTYVPPITEEPSQTSTSTETSTSTSEPTNTIDVELENPGFDDGFYYQSGAGELGVALGWEAYWDESQKRAEFYVMPFQRPADDGLTGSNQYMTFADPVKYETPDSYITAQKFFCQFAPCENGIQQTVEVPVGTECTFETTLTNIVSRDPERWMTSDIFDEYNHPDGSTINPFIPGIEPASVTNYISAISGGSFTEETENVYFLNNPERAQELGIDEIVTLSLTFTTADTTATVYIGSKYRYGDAIQDTIIFDTSLSCDDGIVVPADPAPTEEPNEPQVCGNIETEEIRHTGFVAIGNQPVLECPDGASIGTVAAGNLVSGDTKYQDGYVYWAKVTGDCGGYSCTGWIEVLPEDGRVANFCREEFCESSSLGSNVQRNAEDYSGSSNIYLVEDMDLTAYMASLPTTHWIVFVHWRIGDDFWRAGGYHRDMRDMAEEYWRVTDYFVHHLRTRDTDLSKVCFAGFNEPVFSTDVDGTAEWKAERFAEFEIWRMILAEERGLHACVGKFSTGTPDYPLYEQFDEMFLHAYLNGHPAMQHAYGSCIASIWYNQNQTEAYVNDTLNIFDLRWTEEAHLINRHRGIPYDPIIIADEIGADFVGVNGPEAAWCGGIGRGWRSWVGFWRTKWHDEAVDFLVEMSQSPEFPYTTRQFIASQATETLTDEQLYFAFLLWIDVHYRRDGAYGQIFHDGDFNSTTWGEFSITGTMHDLLYEYINSYHE